MDEHSLETKLIRDILDGERDKYRNLVERYSPMVFHIVRGFVNDEQEVEEMAQQIFVKTYTKLDSFDFRSKFSSWLYMIARNHCRDYAKNIRRQNKRFSEMQQDSLESRMSVNESAEKDLEMKESNLLLERALRSINEDYAEAFLLKYKDELSYKVMSDRLDVSISALKVRVHRARKELRELLEHKL